MIRIARWLTVAAILVAIGIVVEGFVLGSDAMLTQYGIDPKVLTGLGISAEIVFDVTALGLLMLAGRRIDWGRIVRFDLSLDALRVDGIAMDALLLLNLVGWLTPFVYVLLAGWGRAPMWVEGAMSAEIVAHTALCAHLKGWLG